MQKWLVTLDVTTMRGERIPLFSSHKYEFEAEDAEEAKGQILTWARKKLRRFRPGKNRFVTIMGIPRLKNGVLDGARMIRNRDKYSGIGSILRCSPKKLLAVGFGPEEAEKLSR